MQDRGPDSVDSPPFVETPEDDQRSANDKKAKTGGTQNSRSSAGDLRPVPCSYRLQKVHKATKENSLKRRSSKVAISDADPRNVDSNLKPLADKNIVSMGESKLRKRSAVVILKQDTGIDGFPSLALKALHIMYEVVSIELVGFQDLIYIKELKTDKRYQLKLQSIWNQTRLAVGNQLKIIDPFFETEDVICVNQEHGMIVVEPNTLVSSTTLAQALWCRRKAVLSERFRSSDLSLPMTLGSVCHELFQSAIIRRPRIISEAWLLMEFRNNLCSKLLFDFIVLNITIQEFEAQLKPYLKVITEWMKRYMMAPTGRNEALADGTVIGDIEDIETNVWSNTVGVKGRIDVILRKKNGESIPFELKTGKSTWSMEHEAQVLMYCMLMSERRDGKVPSGLLLYLKDATTKPVIPSLPKLKGIMATRNGMALFGGHVGINAFPEPLKEIWNCGKCFYASHCSVLQQYEERDDGEIIMPDMKQFAKNRTEHLAPNELEYGKQWLKWIFAEWEVDKKQSRFTDIFELTADERSTKGKTLANLLLTGTVKKNFGEYWLTFQKVDGLPLLGNVFDLGEVITISTDECIAIDIGSIVDCQLDSITVKCGKEISTEFCKSGTFFHLDRYQSYTVYTVQLNGIISFLEDNAEAKKLREIVIDLKVPKVRKLLPAEVDAVKPILKELSTVQMKAVLKALMADDYSLIQGFPGSGKTSTIVMLIRCLVAMGKSVLLTSYTNTAVDNVMVKLREFFDADKLLRIGGNQATMRMEEMKPLLLTERMAALGKSQNVLQEARTMLMKVPIVGTTCLTASNHQFFKWRSNFDYCIVDEAALCLQSAILKPLMLGSVFTLVGDCLQLAPLVQSENSKDEGMAVSLMERLEPIAEKAGCLTKLYTQYRMNSNICKLSSVLFYDGLLECADEVVANRTLQFENSNVKKVAGYDHQLVELLLSSKKEHSVFFVDTQSRAGNGFNQDESNNKSKSNKGELQLVKTICDMYTSMNVSPGMIGVMSTYRSQVEEFCKVLPNTIETNTVDQFQGKDKDIILISLVHTSKEEDAHRSGSLLTDRRLNVALTRAKKKLVLVGCIDSLKHFPLMERVIKEIGIVHKFNEPVFVKKRLS